MTRVGAVFVLKIHIQYMDIIENKWRIVHKSANSCVTVNKYYLGDKVKTEMDDSNSIVGGGEKFVQQFKLKL
jgi:hypothetical protein